MKNSIIFLGLLSIIAGGGFYYFNDQVYNPQKQAEEFLQKGKTFFEQNNTDALQKAINEFATIASKFPKTPEAKKAMYYLARSYDKLGMQDVALNKYSRLLDANIPPEFKENIRYYMARAELLRSYKEQGLEGLRDMLSKTGNKALRSEIYTEIARHFSRLGNTKRALEYYERAARENSENLIALGEWSKLKKMEPLAKMPFDNYLFSQQKEQVIPPKEEEKNKQDDSSAVAKMFEKLLAAIESLKTQPSQNAELQKKSELAKTAQENPLQKPQDSTKQNSLAAKDIPHYLNRGISLYNQNLDKQAKPYFDYITENFPDTAAADDAFYYLGNIAFRNNDFISAIHNYNAGLSNQNKNRDEICYIRKGEAYYQRKDYMRAANVFETVQKLYPRGEYAYLARDWETEAKNAYFAEKDDSVETPNLPFEQSQTNPPVQTQTTNNSQNNYEKTPPVQQVVAPQTSAVSEPVAPQKNNSVVVEKNPPTTKAPAETSTKNKPQASVAEKNTPTQVQPAKEDSQDYFYRNKFSSDEPNLGG